MIFTCKTCGKKFERGLSAARNRKNVFCSHECYAKTVSALKKGVPIPSLRRGVNRKCLYCGKVFYCKMARIRQGGGNYCSHVCAGFDQVSDKMSKMGKVDNSGKNNGQYKHGGRIGGAYSKSKKKLRKVVAARDSACVICKGKWDHQHHVVSEKEGGKNDTRNVVCLCQICHSKVHGDKKHWQKELLLYLSR